MSDYAELQKNLHDVSGFLIALGDEKRQAIIIKLLENVDCSGLQVSQLMNATKLSRPAVSHHLKVLKDAQIVNYRREGTKNFYYLTHVTTEIDKLQSFLTEAQEIMKRGNHE
ncbi:ArsR family transcriptional regulator [Lactiplantibacillus garii]|uniref:ArsR family transcriptional regulator n=1 Tax=Lactiplantibacillus garii TaxID=2306423 RepID=A0A3R8J6M6_9LACO|nr:winged helix-turn-helix domain-containing protein [Lactiplantibacillus garii]RRK10295.1 ArsR family transcriptional regulator [Lactiplantibacillus garii]